MFAKLQQEISFAAAQRDTAALWHARLEHHSTQALKQIFSFLQYSFDSSNVGYCVYATNQNNVELLSVCVSIKLKGLLI